MNISIQLNNINEQFKNMENQFGFLITQSQNVAGLANIQTSIFSMAIQMFTIGIQMVNVGTQMPSIGMDIINYKAQIQNIGIQIQNLGNQMNMNNVNNNLMMPMQFNFPNNNNIFNNIIEGFNIGVNEGIQNNINNKPKMTICFTSNTGIKRNITFDYGTIVGYTLKKFLYEINMPDLINSDKIYFLYNAEKIAFNNKEKIEKFFNFSSWAKVMANFL